MSSSYTKASLDAMVTGAIALARKRLGEKTTEQAASHLAGVLIKEALEQEDFALYDALGAHAPSR